MIDHKIFFDNVRPGLFRGALTSSQVSGMEALLDHQPDSFRSDYLAYCLATTYHETAKTMQPIEEYGKGKGHAYGSPAGPWHQVYDGRGDVQLTWLANYQKATTRLRALGIIDDTIDLAKEPDLAMRPEIAALIMYIGMVEGWFTGKKLSDYFGPNKSDAVGARRIINGTDQANTIAGYYRIFYAAILKATVLDAGPTIVVRTTIPVNDPVDTVTPSGNDPHPDDISQVHPAQTRGVGDDPGPALPPTGSTVPPSAPVLVPFPAPISAAPVPDKRGWLARLFNIHS